MLYTVTLGCPYISIAQKTLSEYKISFREIFIDKHDKTRQYLLSWTDFLSIPTLIVVNTGDNLPYQAPAHLKKGQSPRGINRGTIITEAYRDELIM